LQFPRLETIVVVRGVLEPGLVAVLAYDATIGRSRTEPRESVVTPEVLATQESDLRVEVVFHNQPIDLQSVSIGVVVDLTQVAQIIAVKTSGP